jgi:L-amino acid N-acyltransferase YncA
MLKIRTATKNDLYSITEIYNDAVLNTTATFDTKPKSITEQEKWFNKHKGKFTVIVAVEDDIVMGWASLSPWSSRAAYSNTADIAVYVKERFRGKGIGKKLIEELLKRGAELGLHTAIAKICEENEASLNLFKKLGFKHIGSMKEVGYKFERLLDVYLMQIIFKAGGSTEIRYKNRDKVMNIEIKEAKKEDLPYVLSLYADIDNENFLTIEKAEKILDKMQSYPNYKIYVAKYNDKIVGTFSLSIMDNIAHLGKASGLVEDVVVEKSMRSKGIGRKMMEYALEICKKNNCYKMSLSSNLKRERAHRFYENLGFEKHGYSFSIEI